MTEMKVLITREEWAKIHRDFKAVLADGTKSAFAGALPKGRTAATGTTLVPVEIATRARIDRAHADSGRCPVCGELPAGGHRLVSVNGALADCHNNVREEVAS